MLSSSMVVETVVADTITTFSDGNSDVTLTFAGQGMNSDAGLLVPVDGTVTSASFDVTGMANYLAYPNRDQTCVGSVRLPHGAQVTSAELRVTGAEHDAGWDLPIKVSHKVGNNYVAINTGYRPTPQLIDFDGDGDLDLLSGGYSYTPTTGRKWIYYFENIGTKT